jgi:hypothetical protein
MNPIGAALLACAAAGCGWAAWVSLRGPWRVVVITVSAALALLVPVVQLGGPTATTERASPPPLGPVGGPELSPAPAVDAAAPPVVVVEPAVETPVPPVRAELAVGPAVAAALPIRPDGAVQLAAEEPAPVPSDVQSPPERRRDAVLQADDTVDLPPTVETPKAVGTAQAAVPSPGSPGHKNKKAPPGQEQPKKAKPAPATQRRRH